MESLELPIPKRSSFFFTCFETDETNRIERVDGILHVDACDLSYDEFHRRYMKANVPVVIRGATEGWNCRKDWVLDSGEPNLQFLRKEFGRGEAYVHASRGKKDEIHVSKRRFEEFLDHWEQGGEEDWYWKDWHFCSEFPRYHAYECPLYFQDDWLNLYYDWKKSSNEGNACNATSDYRFVYMGKKGTKTSFHTDVANSYSWSANICGEKRWILVPPEDAHLLKDRWGREVASSLDEDPGRFPGLKQLMQNALETFQSSGEIIFVPSGWYHMVENVKNTISVNHNWFNATNLQWVVRHIQLEEAQARFAIEDCRQLASQEEFDRLVQRNVLANIGINKDMLHEIMDVALHRLLALGTGPMQDEGSDDLLAHFRAYNIMASKFARKQLDC